MHATTPGNSSAEWAQIASVDSATQITLKGHPFMLATSGLKFSIHRGDGFHFGPGRADNNIHRLDTCLAENLAGAGFRLGGLYGARCTNLQINSAGAYPVVIGSNDLPVLCTSIHGLYIETGLNGASDHVFAGGAGGLTLDTVNAGGRELAYGSSAAFAYGQMTNNQYLTDPGRIEPIGIIPVSYVPVVEETPLDSGGDYTRSSISIAQGARVGAVSVAGVTAVSRAVVAGRDGQAFAPEALAASIATVACGNDGVVTVVLKRPAVSAMVINLIVFP
jgi:hypothetical protein